MAKRATFEAWMAKVDAILIKKTFLTHLDLPDINYRELYDCGETPAYAAKQAIKGLLE